MTKGVTLHIFNPETDFALAHGGNYFTPKASIARLRASMALLPEIWADDGDYILSLDRHADRAEVDGKNTNGKNIKVISVDNLCSLSPDFFSSIRPWGWNLSLRRLLADCGVSETLLPGEDEIDGLRAISHRRTSIMIHDMFRTPARLMPVEIDTVSEVLDWCRHNPYGYLKAPWSSSGRGIYRALPGSGKEMANWVKGTLGRQKSLIAEPDWKQSLDFATEWCISGRNVRFLGFSIFDVDSHSQYSGNRSMPQQDIMDKLESSGWNDSLLSMQRKALLEIVAPHYSGPVGIDALFSPEYGFNLCVELNLRMTMGMVELMRQSVISFSDIYE